MKIKKNHWWFFIIIAAIIVLLDYIVKQWVVANFHYAEPFYLLPFLNLTLAYNRGASFGFLNNQSGWQVIFLSLIAIVVGIGIILWLRKLGEKHFLQALGLSLILGGAVGNLIDRIHYGYVIDFIDFHVNNWHFAFFNVADSAISIGVVFLIIDFLLSKETRDHHDKN